MTEAFCLPQRNEEQRLSRSVLFAVENRFVHTSINPQTVSYLLVWFVACTAGLEFHVEAAISDSKRVAASRIEKHCFKTASYDAGSSIKFIYVYSAI